MASATSGGGSAPGRGERGMMSVTGVASAAIVANASASATWRGTAASVRISTSSPGCTAAQVVTTFDAPAAMSGRVMGPAPDPQTSLGPPHHSSDALDRVPQHRLGHHHRDPFKSFSPVTEVATGIDKHTLLLHQREGEVLGRQTRGA